jgi:ABC-type nitrate/sulfonate/bicarbonate transport system substrate-binding protein
MRQADRPGGNGVTRRVFVGRSTRIFGAAGLIGAAGLLEACGGGSSDSEGKAAAKASGDIITPKVASSTSPLPMFVHQVAGPVLYGAQVGLHMTADDFIAFESHTTALQTLLAHKADVVVGSIVGSMSAIAQGLPIKIFDNTRTRDDNVLAGAGAAKQFSDIFSEKVRVATDSKAGSSSEELQGILNRLHPGASPDELPGYTDLESSSQRQAALASGQVDAAMMHIDQFWAIQEQKPDAVILARSVDTPVFPLSSYAATTAWLDKNLATATAMNKSVLLATKAFYNDFDAYYKAITTLIEEPPSKSVLRRLRDFATKNKIWPTDAHITPDAYGRAARLGEQAEVFIKAPTYKDAVDTRPMDAASPA